MSVIEASRILEKIANEQGWSIESKLSVVLDFLNEYAERQDPLLLVELEDYLRERQDDENTAEA